MVALCTRAKVRFFFHAILFFPVFLAFFIFSLFPLFLKKIKLNNKTKMEDGVDL